MTLYSLAVAVFISAFVTTFIEQQRLKEHQNELRSLEDSLTANVFEALFKRLVPPEVFECVKQDILMCKFVRRDANWIYDFKYDGDKICLKETLKYKLTNSTTEPITDPIVARSETGRLTEESDVLLRASCIIDGDHIVAYDHEQKPEGVTESTDSQGNKQTEINFTIPPKKTAEVTVIWRETYPNCDRCRVHRNGYFTKYPIINGELTVNKPKEMDFDLFQSLSTQFTIIMNEPDRIMYRLRGAILPKQGFGYIFTSNKTSEYDVQ